MIVITVNSLTFDQFNGIVRSSAIAWRFTRMVFNEIELHCNQIIVISFFVCWHFMNSTGRCMKCIEVECYSPSFHCLLPCSTLLPRAFMFPALQLCLLQSIVFITILLFLQDTTAVFFCTLFTLIRSSVTNAVDLDISLECNCGAVNVFNFFHTRIHLVLNMENRLKNRLKIYISSYVCIYLERRQIIFIEMDIGVLELFNHSK